MAVVAGFDPLVVQFTTAAMPRIAVCALSAGDQHMLNTVSWLARFGTRRRLVLLRICGVAEAGEIANLVRRTCLHA